VYADLGARRWPSSSNGWKEVLRQDTVLAALLAGYTRAAELPPGTWYTRAP
jgi:hypothetical protein